MQVITANAVIAHITHDHRLNISDKPVRSEAMWRLVEYIDGLQPVNVSLKLLQN